MNFLTIAQIVLAIIKAPNVPEQPNISFEVENAPQMTIEAVMPRQCYEYTIEETKEIARTKSYELFSEDYWYSLEKVIHRESSWNCQAKNPNSSAFGLGQLIKYQREQYGVEDEYNLDEQLNACLFYIRDRYSNPQEAYQFMLQNNYY